MYFVFTVMTLYNHAILFYDSFVADRLVFYSIDFLKPWQLTLYLLCVKICVFLRRLGLFVFAL